jgi:glutaredoxin-related protein
VWQAIDRAVARSLPCGTLARQEGLAMPRAVLEESRIHPAVRERVARHNADLVAEVEQAIARHPVLVVGMAQNPFPRKARRLLREAGIAHEYLEYGSYLSEWRRRNTLKMWTGWPTFPMVFVRGTLVGGADDLQRLIDSGELKRMLG